MRLYSWKVRTPIERITRVKHRLRKVFLRIRAERLRVKIGGGSYIPPEVYDDDFSRQISKIASKPNVIQLIEIGSSSGEGSTSAIIRGLKGKKNWELHLLEVDPLRLESLRRKYRTNDKVFIHPYSSVAISEYPTNQEVITFYNSTKTNLNRKPLETILTWLEDDRQNILKSNLAQVNGIKKIKEDFKISNFDFALIDGSEFTGTADLRAVMGAKYILLDDVNAYKCNLAYKLLLSDSQYSLEYENWNLRNGFAVFSRLETSLAK